jgi:CarD family transcriptional regulator
MASIKKTDKSRKAKAATAHALKSHRGSAKASKPSESRARQTRSAATRAAPKAKATAKPAASRTKTSAAKLRAAQARLKKQATAAKASRAAAKSASSKSSTAKLSAVKPKTKATIHTSAAAKLKRSTSATRGKSRTGRPAPVETKVTRSEAAAQTAARRTELQTNSKPIDTERRAQAAAVLALRSLRKPTPTAARPLNRPEEASKTSVTQKAAKKTPDVAPAVAPTTAVKAPLTPQPVAPTAKPRVQAEIKPPAPMAEKPKAPKPVAPVKHGFKPLEFVVYPAHGVGQILAIEEQEVAGFKLELFVISFSKDKMILKVPTPKSVAIGMRKLASPEVIKQALTTLTGRARIKRTMWSRRAQEYEAKINSGDLVAIAEVVRDLYRSEAQPEQSYSERQLYEAALDRVAREIAAVQKLTETESLKLIDTQLQKSPRRGKADEAEGDIEAETVGETDESGIEEAA